MDILAKLRIVFWGLIIMLWASFMLQYYHKELVKINPKFHVITKYFETRNRRYVKQLRQLPKEIRPDMQRIAKDAEKLTDATYSEIQELEADIDHKKSGKQLQASLPKPSLPGMPEEPTALPPSTSLVSPSGAENITGVASQKDSSHYGATPQQHSEMERLDVGAAVRQQTPPNWPPPPAGFATAETEHFTIYREKPPIPQATIDALDTLHGNMMLDLIAFSPWKRDEKILLYFFISPQVYQKISGRPYWSGGAASLSRRLIYALENQETMGLIAHELTHMYFDSFFNSAAPSPLWLSEGMAVLTQTEKAYAPPDWLNQELEVLKKGDGFKLETLVSMNSLDGLSEEQVRLWYTQCYSLVRFLKHMKGDDTFYQFSKQLRDGKPIGAALFAAYGMPFNRVSALEYVWREDIKTHKITGVNR